MVHRRRQPRGSSFDFIDLFAGVGGFHVALEDLGGRCVFASEIDAECQDVYERNFGMRPAGDLRPLTEPPAATGIPSHDVLCAGFPCQPFSKSGAQRGMNETRGTLFFNILKILEARRPRFAILENVRNLAGPRQRDTWDTIIRNLRALGYRVASEPTVFSPHLLPARLGGRPQVRDRVFILCEYIGEDASAEELAGDVILRREAVEGWHPQRWRIEDWLQPDAEIHDLDAYSLRPDEVRWIDAWNDFVQTIAVDDLPSFPVWADEFKLVPDLRADLPEWKRNFHQKNSEFYQDHRDDIDAWLRRHDVMSFPASRRKFEWQARGWQPLARDRDLWKLIMHFRPSGIRVKAPTYLPALVAITQTSIIGPRRRRITPREAARLQGFPDSLATHPVDAVAYKQYGNAVNVGAVKYVAEALFNASPNGWPASQLTIPNLITA